MANPADHHVDVTAASNMETLTLSRDVKRACELLEKLQKSKYRKFNGLDDTV